MSEQQEAAVVGFVGVVGRRVVGLSLSQEEADEVEIGGNFWPRLYR